MNAELMQQRIARQKSYFAKGLTLPIANRIRALKSLEQTLKRHESEIYDALQADLGKSETESYMCELGMAYSELSYMLRHIKRFSRGRRVSTPLAQTAAHSYVKPSPRGTVLIMSPWNYPLMLTLDPLVDALAAGNTAILKPSAYAPATSRILETIVDEAFDPALVCLVTGGREENQWLLDQEFDYIFFTGSQSVGKEVLRHAAEHLTPTALELGGKSPCIVDKTANMSLAARRIVFGKYLNCGQTCVAPDYICCDAAIADQLQEALKKEIQRQFGSDPLNNPAYGHIINQKHFDRLSQLVANSNVAFGGRCDPQTLKIEPTVLAPGHWDIPAMEDEIFGPILPILPYHSLERTLEKINARPHPLALYLFSQDRDTIDRVTSQCAFGGGCVNDTVIHLATTQMGFGGVGASGMGAYHGKVGFDAFSHRKSIVDKKTWMDLPMRYQPYTPMAQKIIKLFLR